jgi:hypothetical protein
MRVVASGRCVAAKAARLIRTLLVLATAAGIDGCRDAPAPRPRDWYNEDNARIRRALTETSPAARRDAAEDVRHPGLAAALLEAQDPVVRRIAAARMSGHSLTKVLSGNPDPEVRRRAAAGCTDLAALRNAAMNDSDATVRHAAVDAIRDENTLADVAYRAPSDTVRWAAAARLQSVEQIAALARSGSRADRRRLFRRLPGTAQAEILVALPPGGDRATLLRLCDDDALRVLATRATERDLVAAVARRRGERERASQAVSRWLEQSRDTRSPQDVARDPERLARLALSAPDLETRLEAARRITRRDAALRVIDASTDEDVRVEAAHRVAWLMESPRGQLPANRVPRWPPLLRCPASEPGSVWSPPDWRATTEPSRSRDQDTVLDIATSDPDPGLRASAAAALTRADYLRRVVRGTTDAAVRAAALTRVTDRWLLAEMAAEDPSPVVRRAALCNSRDIDVWRARAELDPDPAIRALAQRQLSVTGP